ncbi:PIR Superfamily Protein [Plasmodium ovale curtisi]|uniref:PIR Superfamily Protein n=1 Tax=Plasmodium ovale curtisi TaxID=864141 RepID=A0A1A8X3U4_PLAOA|nr:PIR Superfamily Protein [Plasmodium ovale curtisi]
MDDTDQNHNDFQKQVLKVLSKYQLYEKLNETCDNCEYCTYCEFSRTVLNKYGEGLYSLCCRFAKNLVTLPIILQEETVENDRCKYLTFWMHNEIIQNFSNYKVSSNNIPKILLKFFQVQSKIRSLHKNNNCFNEYNSNTELSIWKQWKDLYDYIKSYSEIEKKIKSEKNLCSIYSKYIRYIETIYEKYRSECCERKTSILCPYSIKYDEWCNKENFLPKLSCEETETIVQTPVRDLRTQVLDKQQPGDGSHSEAYSSLEDQHEKSGHAITSNTDYYSKIGGSLSFLGILSTLFYLYNFTSFGTWVRSKIPKKKKKVNLDEDEQHFRAHELNNVDENIFTDDYNITYNPS